jgi:hypothetical protein
MDWGHVSVCIDSGGDPIGIGIKVRNLIKNVKKGFDGKVNVF